MPRERADGIEPGLSLGPAPDTWVAADFAPFQAVVNVADGAAVGYAARLPPACELVCSPFEDNVLAPFPRLALACLELARFARAGRTTLVHCKAGQSRSPTVIALFLMARDGVTWDTAVARLRARRPMVAPHPLLTTPSLRGRIVPLVRACLGGDERPRADTQNAVAGLDAAERERPPEIAVKRGDWNVVSAGLAIGSSPTAATNVREFGFSDTVSLGEPTRTSDPREHGFPEIREEHFDPTDAERAAAVVGAIAADGGGCYVRCREGRLLSPAIAALVLMNRHGWDYGSAFAFLKQRRRGILPQPLLTR